MTEPYQPDNEEIATRIREGTYFEEARRWYDVVYLNPISERYFFVVVVVLGVLIFLFSFSGLMGLMPLKPREPFVYPNENMVDLLPRIERLREDADADVNKVISEYYLAQYVRMREGYYEPEFTKYRRFMQNYSDNAVYNEYNRMIQPSNPRSPVRQYGKHNMRNIDIRQIQVNRAVEPDEAVINFTAEVITAQGIEKSNWTARVKFFYSGISQQELDAAANGGEDTRLTMPEFQVVGYNVQEQMAGTAQ